MLVLGIDIGTSSIKVSVTEPGTGSILASAQYPDTETPILSPKPGFAEQSPLQWWSDVQSAIQLLTKTNTFNPTDIAAIGISYQMHGLVLIDDKQQVLRNSIIWCDSRAVDIGRQAAQDLGSYCHDHLLNSPGNFTASKLAWVKQNEPDIYRRIYKIMLPGDFIALQLTGELTTTPSALSEGIFWDFRENALSSELLQYFDFDPSFIPEIKDVFGNHGLLKKDIAEKLGLKAGIPVSYKAGDQPNNALALNVLQPGEVAATAGTSGVIYAVTDHLAADPASRINSFAHVNHTAIKNRIGVLLNINGCGSMNRWIRQSVAAGKSYEELNNLAAGIRPGSEGVQIIPFGNGAERMLENRITGAQIRNLDLNIHEPAHLFRATQEGIAYAFRYGLDIMRQNNIHPDVIRVSHSNMFLSPVFTGIFVNVTGIPVEQYTGDGSAGAAKGAAIGAGMLAEEAAASTPLIYTEPDKHSPYNDLYEEWKQTLDQLIFSPEQPIAP